MGSLAALLALAVACEIFAPSRDERSGRSDGRFSAGSTEAENRGRNASTPTEIPARSWKNILLRVYSNISKHRVLSLAAGMTYYGILAIFPAIAALVALYGLFADPTAIAKHLDQAAGFLPNGAIDIAREQLARVASKGAQTLGATFLIGLATSLWSANAAMKSLFDTLNIVHDEEDSRGFLKLNAVSLSFTVGAVEFVLAALGSIVVVPIVLQFVGLSDAGDLLLRAGRWLAIYVVLTFALAVIYRYGPDRETARWRWIT